MKEEPVYYKKTKKRLGDCKEGEWVYNSTADLCYVTEEKDGHRNLHYFAIESYCGKDTIVYPLSLTTKEIMDRMKGIYDKYHNNRIMNANIRRELENDLEELMNIDHDKYDEDEGQELSNAYEGIWLRVERILEERLEYARKLLIIK